MIRSVFILPAMSRTGIYKADKKTQLSSNQRPLKNNDKRHFRVEASSCLDIPAGFNLSESGLSEDILKSSALVRFRPGPPRILKTRDVVHRIPSVSRGLAPFP
jgi:hypothetical protein